MDLTQHRLRLRESAKLVLRNRLGQFGLALGTDPFANRLCRALTAREIDTVLDVGANVGQFASLIRAAGFGGRIVSVEPLSTALPELRRRARGDGSWTVVASAVGATHSRTQINISANSFSSSLRPVAATHLEAAPESVTVGTEWVPVTTVESLVREHHLNPTTALLKVDTQGFESEVLDGAGDLINRFAGIQLELSLVELYTGQSLMRTMTERMERHGLELWGLEPGFADQQGRMLQCDAFFLRP